MTAAAQIHTVEGGGGLRLHVREWGRPDGIPIVFIHGWSQSHLCWSRQYASDLAHEFRLVAYDLRGHGMSQMPTGPEHYADGRLWADDLAAIISQLRLVRPVLVGWSYGPLVMLDYVRAYGQQQIAAMNFAGGAVTLNAAAFGTLIGPTFLEHFPDAISEDLPTNISALRSFLRACSGKPLPAEVFETALASAMVVAPQIRANLAGRQLDGDDVLRDLEVPVLVSHGRLDSVVLPAMAEHVVATCDTAEISWYDGVGHVPFLEDPGRFNLELAELARRLPRGASCGSI